MPHDLTAKEFQRELRMLKSPSEWPLLVLPLKRSPRYVPEPISAILFEGEPTIYYANLFAAKGIDFATCPKKTYPDYEGILDDGWRVD
jgi:hypothetical protein